jgi:hypothetical protein
MIKVPTICEEKMLDISGRLPERLPQTGNIFLKKKITRGGYRCAEMRRNLRVVAQRPSRQLDEYHASIAHYDFELNLFQSVSLT